ncbi:MAG: HAMP domain-containing sensor histidine kinase [Panacibacter sp.]
MNKLRLSKALMTGTILLIVAFQCYWINRLYNDEWLGLKKQSDVIFRDVVYKLQLQRFRNDTGFFDKSIPDNLFVLDVIDSVKEKMIDSAMKHTDERGRQVNISVISGIHHDSMNETYMTTERTIDSIPMPSALNGGPPRLIKYFSSNKVIRDTLPLAKIDSAYKAELLKNGITLIYTLKNIKGKANELDKTVRPDELKTNFTFVGLSQSNAYQASFVSPVTYIINKIKFPILFSFLLIAFTTISFVFLYRNLLAQRRIAAMKNEFISNISHELKTPIATVTAAVEALRNFNAIQNPERTKEYLEISASELQRLSLLVDKVLRLSMFENREIELKKEHFDLKGLVENVISTMALQFENKNAKLTLKTTGDNFIIDADKLHITSVIYNLLDNALKYSKEDPVIEVELLCHEQYIDLRVKDNGIGIANEYQQKIFEKFFRVPDGDHHNAKGYGLGLSYVSHILQRHQGFVEVKSEQGKGSVFTAKIPYKEAPVIYFDDKRRSIRKEFKL